MGIVSVEINCCSVVTLDERCSTMETFGLNNDFLPRKTRELKVLQAAPLTLNALRFFRF